MGRSFFYGDRFCSDMEDLLFELDLTEVEDVEDLPDDWKIKVELTTLEPMFKLEKQHIIDFLYDRFDDRFSEDNNEEKQIEKAVESLDLEKFNPLIPKLNYTNNEFIEITKKDLLDYL